jgi:hypothetical protein
MPKVPKVLEVLLDLHQKSTRPPATQPFDVDLLKVGDKLVDQLEAVKTWYFF